MIFFENDYITIHYEPANKLAYTQWHQFAPSNEYRKALNKYIDLVKDYPVTSWVGDTTNAKVIRPNDQDWTTNEWLPNFAQYGVKRMAVIVSKDVFNRMSVESLLKKAGGKVPFDTRFFTDGEAARAWALEEHQAAAQTS